MAISLVNTKKEAFEYTTREQTVIASMKKAESKLKKHRNETLEEFLESLLDNNIQHGKISLFFKSGATILNNLRYCYNSNKNYKPNIKKWADIYRAYMEERERRTVRDEKQTGRKVLELTNKLADKWECKSLEESLKVAYEKRLNISGFFAAAGLANPSAGRSILKKEGLISEVENKLFDKLMKRKQLARTTKKEEPLKTNAFEQYILYAKTEERKRRERLC